MGKKTNEQETKTNEAHKKLGELIREKRKERHLSLKAVENAISVRINYLQAVEEGKICKIISPAYAQGFVRQYANFLGIDADTIIQENPNLFNAPTQQECVFNTDPFEAHETPESKIKWLPNILRAGLFALIIFTAWLLAKYLNVI